MKVRRLMMIAVITLAAVGPLGAAQGISYMRATYGGVCSKLTGLPGMMQRLNIVPPGTCVLNNQNKCKTPGSTCKTSTVSGAPSGICTNQSKFDCQCIRN